MARAAPGAASAVPLRVTTSVLVPLCDVASVLTRHTPLHHSLQTPMPLCPYGADRRWEIAVAAEGDTTAAQRHEDLAALPVATTAPADAELAKEDTYLQCPYRDVQKRTGMGQLPPAELLLFCSTARRSKRPILYRGSALRGALTFQPQFG